MKLVAQMGQYKIYQSNRTFRLEKPGLTIVFESMSELQRYLQRMEKSKYFIGIIKDLRGLK